MRLMILFLFVLLPMVKGHGQACPPVRSRNDKSIIYLEECTPLDKKSFFRKSDNKLDNRTEEKKQIEEKIKVELSQNILTKVSSESRHSVKEFNKKFDESFNETIILSSDIDLSGIPEIKYCENPDVSYCGYLEVDKLDIAESIESSAKLSMQVLKSELVGKQLNEMVAISPLKERYNKILAQHGAALSLGLNEDNSEWPQLIESVASDIGRLESSNAQKNIEKSIVESQKLINNKKFKEGIALLNQLKVTLSGENRFERLWDNAVEDYKAYVHSTIPVMVENNKFDDALRMIEEMCWEIPCDNDMIEMQRVIKKKCFRSTSEQFSTAVKYKIRNDIDRHWSKLESLRDVDVENYAKMYDKYIAFKREDELLRARNYKHLRQFRSAYDVLTNLERNYGRSDREISSLKSELVRKMYREEARGIKSSRPYLFSIWAGVEGFANDLNIDSISKFQMKYYYFGYSGGLFYKYRFESSNWRKNYPVQSDFIGLKFRMLDFRSLSSKFLADTLSYLAVKRNDYHFDVALDGVLYRMIHYSAGVNVNKAMDWSKPNYYFFSAGIRIPLGYFAIISDCTAQTLFDGKSNFV